MLNRARARAEPVLSLPKDNRNRLKTLNKSAFGFMINNSSSTAAHFQCRPTGDFKETLSISL